MCSYVRDTMYIGFTSEKFEDCVHLLVHNEQFEVLNKVVNNFKNTLLASLRSFWKCQHDAVLDITLLFLPMRDRYLAILFKRPSS